MLQGGYHIPVVCDDVYYELLVMFRFTWLEDDVPPVKSRKAMSKRPFPILLRVPFWNKRWR